MQSGGAVLMEWREAVAATLVPYLAPGFFGRGSLPARPAAAWPSVKVKVGPQGLVLDDFEGDTGQNFRVNPWRVLADPHNLGSWVDENMRVANSGWKSDYALRFAGRLGEQRAPWPFVLASTRIVGGDERADLSDVYSIEWMARGDGARYEMVLVDDGRADENWPAYPFTASKRWKKNSWILGEAGPAAVRELRLRPVSGGKDFEMYLDQVVLRAPAVPDP
jgi:hypothetical protein